MIELFADLPKEMKLFVSNFIDWVFKQYSPNEATVKIKEMADICQEHPRLQDFIDFYFNLKMELLNNENNSN